MKLPLRFERREGFEEQMRVLKRPYGEHEGYPRENDGTWIILDAEGFGVVRVAFQGTAKRGQGWNAPDPEGMKLARLIVESVNAAAAGPVTHVICFEGEGAEAILCRGWDDCREKFFDGIFGSGHHDRDEEQVKGWDEAFADEELWTKDENGKRYRFASDLGEMSKVRIYCVAAA